MAQTYHKIGFIAFGQRGQQLAETLINYLPEYGCPEHLTGKCSPVPVQ